MATALSGAEAAAPRRRPESLFYPSFALATAAAAFAGFAFTYFGPMLAGSYPAVSPFVHVHGWSFFLWYLLFPMQAALLATRRHRHHMAIGRLSLALAAAMIVTGLFVLTVRMDDALAGPGDGFLMFLRSSGGLVLSSLLLFALFYGAAIRAALKGRMEAHKRLMVLASSAGLGAALFRIFMVAFGPAGYAVSAWPLATNAFMVAAMIYDKAAHGRVHRVYWGGLAIALAVEALVWPFPGNPVIPPLNAALAAIGEQIRFVY